MDEAAFEKKLNELVNEIGSIPLPQRDKLKMLAKQTKDCHKQLKRSVNNLQESLDYLRVSIKYTLFDLEATRRENAYLRKLLEDDTNR
jgi:nitric oxide reductase activation protein